MKIHEFQAKQLFTSYAIPVLPGTVATTPEEAKQAAESLGGTFFAVKAQVHAGGRGKAGGIKTATSPAEVDAAAKTILGMKLVTPQTGLDGKLVRKVYIEKGCQIAREFYFALLTDGSRGQLVFIASSEGGMDIERLAAEKPGTIFQHPLDSGYQPKLGMKIAEELNVPLKAAEAFSSLCMNLCRLYMEKDCTLIEINPLVLTPDHAWIALDAKVTFDDNALARHPDIQALRDPLEEDPLEARASTFGFSYIRLNGSIGCMVNGAGLAMATMDIIKLYGEEPANFLDVGGSATEETVAAAFEIIMADHRVKAILVNIFGGIIKCDVIASGILAAAKKNPPKVPLVVRLEGTHVERGREMLSTSSLNIIAAATMKEAAEAVVTKLRETRTP